MVHSMNDPCDVMPNKRLLTSLNQITNQADSLDDFIEEIHSHFQQVDLRNKEVVHDFFYTGNSEETQIKTLSNKCVSLQQNCIYVAAELFEHGGIKGTSLGSYNKKEPLIKQLKKDLKVFNLAPINPQTPNPKLNFKDKALFRVLTLLSAIQNDIRKLESAWINFLIVQTTKVCRGCYTPFNIWARPNTPRIHLGETYHAEVISGYSLIKKHTSIQVNGETQTLIDNKANYQIKPTSLGQHSYIVKALFQDPQTEKMTSLQDTFFFEVHD
jgi:hypothetical protein